jgi:hypothetical protein
MPDIVCLALGYTTNTRANGDRPVGTIVAERMQNKQLETVDSR